MKEYKISNKGSARLFDSPLLERLTRTHFAFPVFLYYFAAVLCLLHAMQLENIRFIRVVYMFPFGMLSFTLVEYLIHRFLFHFHPTSPKEEQLKYHIHGVHHEFPKDKDRLVMPPVMSILVAAFFFVLFLLLFDQYVWLFFPGFLTGYSTYLIIHYAVHRYRQPRNFLSFLWKHHSLHHYKSEETAFAVSFPIWDYLFGTMPFKGKNRDRLAEDKLPDEIK